MGARFAKWRAVLAIGDGVPTLGCIEANAHALARYAALCQEAGLVPVVEPEVLMEGAHPLNACGEMTEQVLRIVFRELYSQRVRLEGLILKPNMVLPGSTCPTQEDVDEIADATVECLLRAVPAAVPGDRVPIWRTVRGTCLGPSQCHECPIQDATTLGAGVFLRSRHPGAGLADMAWRSAATWWRLRRPSTIERGAIVRHGWANTMPCWSTTIALAPCPNFRLCSRGGLMMMDSVQQKTIVGNWKMHTTSSDARQLARGIVDGLRNQEGVSVILCPPFPYLALVGDILKGSRIALGAQNMYPEKEGAFTGEVSPTMLLDLGCKFVILGHSERRHKLGESDAFINQKVKVALAAGLDVILCVGETLEQRKANQTEALLDRQLGLGLANVQNDTLRRVSIAYEPVWAIGNAQHHATPQQAQEAHAVLRARFGQIFGKAAADAVSIQYGGSVVPDDAAALLSRPGVDGALIGGASLIANEFVAIARSAIAETREASTSR